MVCICLYNVASVSDVIGFGLIWRMFCFFYHLLLIPFTDLLFAIFYFLLLTNNTIKSGEEMLASREKLHFRTCDYFVFFSPFCVEYESEHHGRKTITVI